MDNHIDTHYIATLSGLPLIASSPQEILVENQGRVNYGPRISDQRKGIVGNITVGRTVPEQAKMPSSRLAKLLGFPKILEIRRFGDCHVPIPC